MSKVIYRPNIIPFEESVKAQKEISSISDVLNMPENRIYKSAKVKVEPYSVNHGYRSDRDTRKSKFNGQSASWDNSQVILATFDGNTEILGFINRPF